MLTDIAVCGLLANKQAGMTQMLFVEISKRIGGGGRL